MKGTKLFPQCGFSNTAVRILLSITEDFETFDVLADNEVREGIKTYSNWPTIPQCYIDGEFVGGCDLLIEMYQNGELQEMVEKARDARALHISLLPRCLARASFSLLVYAPPFCLTRSALLQSRALACLLPDPALDSHAAIRSLFPFDYRAWHRRDDGGFGANRAQRRVDNKFLLERNRSHARSSWCDPGAERSASSFRLLYGLWPG